MSWPLSLALVAVGTVAAFRMLHLVWRLHGVWRIRRAGPFPILATRHRIWHEVHSADANDLRFGPGGEAYVPKPPFEFVEELLSGREMGSRSEARDVLRQVHRRARIFCRDRFARALTTRIQALHEAVASGESREISSDEGRRTIKTA